MKPFARINLSSVALRRGILVLTLVLAAAAEAKLAPPKLEAYTHVCKKCGGATHYPARANFQCNSWLFRESA